MQANKVGVDDLEQRKIARGVEGDQLSHQRQLGLLRFDEDFTGLLDNMSVGQDATRRNDHARAAERLRAFALPRRARQSQFLLDRDAHHRLAQPSVIDGRVINRGDCRRCVLRLRNSQKELREHGRGNDALLNRHPRI